MILYKTKEKLTQVSYICDSDQEGIWVIRQISMGIRQQQSHCHTIQIMQ